MIANLLTFVALVDFWKCFFVLVGLQAFEVCLVQVNSELQQLFLFVFIIKNETDQISWFIASATLDSLETFEGKLLSLVFPPSPHR